MSSILNLESPINSLRNNSEETLNQELTFAAHLGLPAITFSLTSDRCTNVARMLHNKVVQGVCYQVSGVSFCFSYSLFVYLVISFTKEHKGEAN